MASRGVVHEQVVARQQIQAVQRPADARRIRERRNHVGAEQQQDADAARLERLGDLRHLVRDVVAGPPSLARGDAGETLAMRHPRMPRSHAGALDAEISRECRQTGNGARALPALDAFVHRAAAEEDHPRPGRGIAARQRDDAIGAHAGGRCRPLHVMLCDVGGERVEAESVPLDESGVVQPLADDDVHHSERERGVGPRPDQQGLVRLRRRLRLPHVDGDDVRAAALRGSQVTARQRLARDIRSPEEDERRVRPHVLLRVHAQNAGEAEAEGAEPPADHRRAPPLAAVQVGEPAEQLGRDPRAVVVGEESMPRPGTDCRRPDGTRPRGDGIQRVFPGRALPRSTARRTAKRMHDALWIADDLARRLAADAE